MNKILNSLILENVLSKIISVSETSGGLGTFTYYKGKLLRKYEIRLSEVHKDKINLIRELIDICVPECINEYELVLDEARKTLSRKVFEKGEVEKVAVMVYLLYCLQISNRGDIRPNVKKDSTDIAKFVAITGPGIEVVVDEDNRVLIVKSNQRIIFEVELCMPYRFYGLELTFSKDDDGLSINELESFGIIPETISCIYSSMYAVVDMNELTDEFGFVEHSKRDFYSDVLKAILKDRVKYIEIGHNLKPKEKRVYGFNR